MFITEETGGTGYSIYRKKQVFGRAQFCVALCGGSGIPRASVEAGLRISLDQGDPVTLLRLLQGTQVYLVI